MLKCGFTNIVLIALYTLSSSDLLNGFPMKKKS